MSLADQIIKKYRAGEYSNLASGNDSSNGVADRVIARYRQNNPDPLTKSLQEAERYAKEATEARKKEAFWSSIANLPKEIVNRITKNVAPAIADVALRNSPIEAIRNIGAGVSSAVRGDGFQQGFTESRARPLLYERTSGQTIPTGNLKETLTSKEGRGFIGASMEAPTYFYGGSKALVQKPTGNIATRLGKRTLGSVPEAGIQTGIQAIEEGNIRNAPRNFAGNLAAMSTLGNVIGETTGRAFNKAVRNLEKDLGKLTTDETVLVARGLKNGLDEDAIKAGLQKTRDIDVEPKAPARVFDEEAGVFNAQSLSKEIPDSILNIPSKADAKPNRLSGKEFSIKEAKTGISESGKDLKGRIVLGKDDAGNVTLKDGTYLLEAYRREGIDIPKDKIKFEDGTTLADLGQKVDDLAKKVDNTKIEEGKVIKETVEAGAEKPEIAQSQFAKRLNEELPDNLKIDEEYNVASLKGEAEKAANLVAQNKEKAIRIANGMEKADANTQTAVSIALAENAKKNGDWDAVASLFNQRRLANTRRGQEIAMEKLSVALSPEEKYMKQVVDARTRRVKVSGDDIKKGETKANKVDRKVKADSKKFKETIKKSYQIKEAQSLLNELTCRG